MANDKKKRLGGGEGPECKTEHVRTPSLCIFNVIIVGLLVYFLIEYEC